MTSSLSSLPSSLNKGLTRQISQTDTRIAKLTRLLSTPAGADKFLLTIYYALKLLYPQITRVRSLQFRHFLKNFVNKASASLLPGETLITILEQRDDDFLSNLELSMRAGAGMITDFRIFTRLWGLLSIYAWAKGTWINPPQDGILHGCQWGQVVACGLFQFYENMAYLAGKGVLRGQWCNATKQGKWWVYSCRFWLVHISLEALRLMRTWQMQSAEKQRIAAQGGEGEKETIAKKQQTDVDTWRRAWYTNAAYAPIAVHYSVPGYALSDDQMGLCGVIVGSIGLRYMWKQLG